MMESLGKLAFEQLQKGNLIFYESDLTECGIDIRAASVYSGVFTQIFREETGLYQDKVFCFVHLSVQEFLAALHVHLIFISSGVNLMAEEQTLSLLSKVFRDKPKLTVLHQSAVDKALQSPNGHLDLFLRFLLGLSLETNQTLLRGLLKKTGSGSQTKQKTADYIKKKISENLSPERSINLFHCLNELKDHSLVDQIQEVLSSGSLSTDKLSPAQWSALVFILLSSDKDLDVFDLKKYSASEEVLLRLLPVVKASNKALLDGCNLSERSCEALSSVLSSYSLTELDLSNNKLKDSGVKLLSAGLKSPHCKVENLNLSGCLVTNEGCAILASALNSNTSYLKKLDLSNNNLKDSGVKHVSALLENPHCKLETLRLPGCYLTERSCEALSSVLSSSSLTELDLSNNNLKDSGVKLLCVGLKSPHFIENLNLSGCLVTEEGCAALASALNSNTSYLKKLDLSNNNLKDSGVRHLSVVLENPHCKLETLRLPGCYLTERSCEALSSVLISSSLTELDLSNNDLMDSGVKLLSAGLKSPHCKLENVNLSGCLVTEEGCAALASTLNSNLSHMRELDLSYNNPGDTGVKLLSAGLDTLRVDHCGEQWLKPGLRKYSCELTLDPNTANRKLKLSDNNMKVTAVEEEQPYPDHPERFDYWRQLLCRTGLTGRCYWEVEWRGRGVEIAVSYRGIRRRGGSVDSWFGRNDQSWSLNCCGDSYYVCHRNRGTSIPQSSSSSFSSSSLFACGRVAVYVDCPAGILSFYRVSSDKLIHLYTFNSTFTEPLYPGFRFWSSGSSVSLCSLKN